ncbi:hypothetical protein ACFFV7_44630 [Nonomuraea spiralis]|uniref:Uncharacterized protein n=1 Tax=Nonomuraea spiralis TaxID=46182 RepID=A0ABV5IUW7_9ACTN|nr:hypothetical protein [Nonomuraea spiralis]GGT46916.1 hypothetical protein GCM10010176_107270 [Nonomuraea spiralis]
MSEPHPATDDQKWLIEFQADVQVKRDAAERRGQDVADWDEATAGIDAEINAAGMRGNVTGGRTASRRSRSTRRRLSRRGQDQLNWRAGEKRLRKQSRPGSGSHP